MAQKCPNCGSAITCSCQLRTASDGTRVCSKCIVSYEANLKTNNSTEAGISIISAAVFPK